MVFLNPFVLFGLAAAAIPVILHFLNLRRLRTVEFSSLRFLKELQKTKMRRLRIRQLLLLALRVLLIAALVLAFSRPALHGTAAGITGGSATATMAVVLDDSPSMSVRNEHGTLFAQAKEAAAAILSLTRQGDRVYLIRQSEVGRSETLPAYTSGGAATEALQRIGIADAAYPFRDVLPAAEKILAKAGTVNRELYLVTDGQASQCAPPSGPDSSSPDPRVKAFLVKIPSDQPGNLAVVSADVTTRIVTRDRPVELAATLANYASGPARNQTMSVFLEGARCAQQSLDVGPFASVAADFAVVPKRRGALQGYVQIDDDPLEADNRRYFTLDVPDNIRILLAGSVAADTKYPSLALTLEGDSTVAGLFTVHQVLQSHLASTDFNKYDVIVLCNVSELEPVESERIAQFVKAGGGLMVFPGPVIDGLNRTLLPGLGIAPVTADSKAPLPGGTRRTFLSFERIDYAHPLFAGLFDRTADATRTRPSIESPKVFTAVRLRTAPAGHAIITLGDGDPFLVEYPSGQGRVLLFSVESGLSGSDFPVKGLYAPLLHRAVMYLSAENEGTEQYTAGSDLRCTVKLKDLSEQSAYFFRSPSGVDVRVVPAILSSTGLASFTLQSAGESGIYRLLRSGPAGTGTEAAEGTPLRCVAVNIDTSESDLRTAGPEELTALFRSAGIVPRQLKDLPPSADLGEVVRQSRYGVELWRQFLLLALVLALVEMAVARGARREGAEERER